MSETSQGYGKMDDVQIQRFHSFVAGGFVDESKVYVDRRYRTNPSTVGYQNFDTWETNNMRPNDLRMHNGPSSYGYYSSAPTPAPPGPMRPLIDSYNQPATVRTQQVGAKDRSRLHKRHINRFR
jgi:hypothetical protein